MSIFHNAEMICTVCTINHRSRVYIEIGKSRIINENSHSAPWHDLIPHMFFQGIIHFSSSLGWGDGELMQLLSTPRRRKVRPEASSFVFRTLGGDDNNVLPPESCRFLYDVPLFFMHFPNFDCVFFLHVFVLLIYWFVFGLVRIVRVFAWEKGEKGALIFSKLLQE